MKKHEQIFHKSAGSHIVPGTISTRGMITKNSPAKSNSKAPLGQGGRFAALKNKLAKEKGVANPAALAAAIGRKKYGTKKMTQLSTKGRMG